MVFKLACGDVMPGCTARFEDTDVDVLMREVAEHAAEDHGVQVITPEVRAAIAERIITAP